MTFHSHTETFPDKTDSCRSQPMEWQGLSKRKAARLQIQNCYLFCHESLKINLSGEFPLYSIGHLFYSLIDFKKNKNHDCFLLWKGHDHLQRQDKRVSCAQTCTVTNWFLSPTINALTQKTPKTIGWVKTICHSNECLKKCLNSSLVSCL